MTDRLESVPPKARYIIESSFVITDRGLVFSGILEDGMIQPGDYLLFEKDGSVLLRKITGVDFALQAGRLEEKMGVMIECKDEEEIENLRTWIIDRVPAEVYAKKDILS